MQVSPSSEPDTSRVEALQLFERVFVVVDFSAASRRAVATALELRRSFGSRVCLFHLAELDGSDEFLAGLGSPAVASDLVEEATGRLQRYIRNIAPNHADEVELRSRRSVSPIDDMHREAMSWRATLVIAATESHATLLRSPAEKLVHDFDIPVLVIPSAVAH